MYNKITLIGLISLAIGLNGMEDSSTKQQNDLLVNKNPILTKNGLTEEEKEYVSIIKNFINEFEDRLEDEALKDFRALNKPYDLQDQFDTKTAKYLLDQVFSIGNALRTLKNDLVVSKNCLIDLPFFQERGAFLEKIPKYFDKIFEYLKQLKCLLELIKNKCSKTSKQELREAILYKDSLSFADDLECFMSKNNFSTKRIALDDRINHDIVVYEPKLLMGISTRALIDHKPKIPASVTLQKFNDIVGSKVVDQLVGGYKIHLMPQDDDLEDVVFRLLKLIKENSELQKFISGVKIKALKDAFLQYYIDCFKNRPDSTGMGYCLPKIVVYVGGGKDKAQKVLDLIYAFFKDYKGIDRAPSYNECVTSLIYFAQGNRDDKVKYPQLFEDDRIYYKPDITGIYQDYRLKNPAKK